jgi:hypothetical protein
MDGTVREGGGEGEEEEQNSGIMSRSGVIAAPAP